MLQNIYLALFILQAKASSLLQEMEFFLGEKSVRGGEGFTIPSYSIQEHTLSYFLILYYTIHYPLLLYYTIHYPLILYQTTHHYNNITNTSICNTTNQYTTTPHTTLANAPPNMENVRQKNGAHPIHYHTIFHHTHHNTTAIPNLESVREQKGSLRSVLHAPNIGHPQGGHGLQ